MDKQEILEAIYAAIDDVNEQLSPSRQLRKTPDARLFGQDAILDSLGLVNLIVATEQQIEERFKTTVTLADEKAVSQRNSPFRTVDTLAEYIAEQLKGEGG